MLQGVIDAGLLAALESGIDLGVNRIVPQLIAGPVEVPEPGSLALLIMGIAGMFGARRRVKAPA